MRLNIVHTTEYNYDEPVSYALQQVRLTPKSRPSQNVVSWSCDIQGGKQELEFEDEHANRVVLVSTDPGETRFVLRCEGIVETIDTAGVVGEHAGFVPLWCFNRTTELTKPGKLLRELVRNFDRPDEDVPCLHALSDHILNSVAYKTGQTNSLSNVEDAIETGSGVCQDHAHIFIAAARHLGYPARYVSGYFMMPDRIQQDAGHAWAEAHVDGIGWIGFDISNGQSPDERHVRVATGLDASEAAPVSGAYFGSGGETMRVALQVQQQ